jgi:hypothetical protein
MAHGYVFGKEKQLTPRMHSGAVAPPGSETRGHSGRKLNPRVSSPNCPAFGWPTTHTGGTLAEIYSANKSNHITPGPPADGRRRGLNGTNEQR